MFSIPGWLVTPGCRVEMKLYLTIASLIYVVCLAIITALFL